tara:strand:+ start:15593 stop:16684 length:1092 start_codon:yes stop_codon:yes gene_type:complete
MTFGYTVGNLKFADKLKAIEVSLESNDPLSFHTPTAYENFDFSHEPVEDLKTLLKHEAVKIRSKYDNVRLYYSGGSDSKLMLDTFIDNNIPIDEIVCLKSGITDADAEIDHFALPYLATRDLGNSKVNISCPSKKDYIDFYKKGIAEKINKGMLTWDPNFRIGVKHEYYNEKNFRNNTVNLHGYDKPKVMNVNGKWYAYFLDVDIEPTAHTYHFFSRNPKLHSKQAHLCMQFMKNRIIRESDIWKYQKEWNNSIGRESVSLPTKKLFFGAKDNFVPYNGHKLYYSNEKEKIALGVAIGSMPEAIDGWIDTLNELKSYTTGTWWSDGQPELGTVGVFSKFYCLSQKETKTVDQLFPDGFKNLAK